MTKPGSVPTKGGWRLAGLTMHSSLGLKCSLTSDGSESDTTQARWVLLVGKDEVPPGGRVHNLRKI